jgi:hypothetical protein
MRSLAAGHDHFSAPNFSVPFFFFGLRVRPQPQPKRSNTNRTNYTNEKEGKRG